jgi:[protein-PII] uridylyltransferase
LLPHSNRKWYFDVDLLSDLVEKEYLTQSEYDLLIEAQSFLWKVRFALHIVAKRREDRVAFQYQRKIASVLGYKEGNGIVVEQFMRDYLFKCFINPLFLLQQFNK